MVCSIVPLCSKLTLLCTSNPIFLFLLLLPLVQHPIFLFLLVLFAILVEALEFSFVQQRSFALLSIPFPYGEWIQCANSFLIRMIVLSLTCCFLLVTGFCFLWFGELLTPPS